MRDPERSKDLLALGDGSNSVTPVNLEVTDEDQIAAVVSLVGERHGKLDLLVNNAADYGHQEEGVTQTRAEEMLRVLAVNSVAPIIITRHCLPLLEAATAEGGRPAVVTVSSGASLLSRELPEPGSQYSYGASKAALNMYLVRLAADLRERGIISIGMSPGFVLTGMTQAAGLSPTMLPPESAAGQIKVIQRLTLEDAGKFYRYTGEEQNWAAKG
jgi:NAD(P)-dependent dehydrogenase (short-subunit alcohol dehydrogenase family)